MFKEAADLAALLGEYQLAVKYYEDVSLMSFSMLGQCLLCKLDSNWYRPAGRKPQSG